MMIVVSTGGSGGHVFPALQTATVLKAKGHEVVFIGSLGLGLEKIKAKGFEAINITAKGLISKSPIGLLSFANVMIQAIAQAREILKQRKPQKVIGFGGYGSFAVVVAARLLNIPVMIHEQNVIPGKANRLLSRFVKKIAISFPETKKYFDSHKAIWTGCPCQNTKVSKTKEDLFKKFSLDVNKKTILVLGGSQGSQRINETFFEMMLSLKSNNSLQAIHMTGSKDFPFYKTKYQDEGLSVKVMEFISPIEEAYAVADVVIARAGAVTISELGFFMIPSILIPYPLADGHQKFNAQVLVDLKLARIIEQKDLTRDRLHDEIKLVLNAPLNNFQMTDQLAGQFKKNPELELANVIEGL